MKPSPSAGARRAGANAFWDDDPHCRAQWADGWLEAEMEAIGEGDA